MTPVWTILALIAVTILVLVGPIRWLNNWFDRRAERRVEERRAQFHSVRFPDDEEPPRWGN